MKECNSKSIMITIGLFLGIVIYCTLSIFYRFSYIDLAYLLVVIVYFAVYLRRVKII